jgi:endonuclease YncB( thermonuclease family)
MVCGATGSEELPPTGPISSPALCSSQYPYGLAGLNLAGEECDTSLGLPSKPGCFTISSMKCIALAVTLYAFTAPVAAQSLSGRADVMDGDTLAIQGEPTRIRLYGIDAPEGKQTCDDAPGRTYLCGSRSADALASIIGRNGRVTCREEDRDRYGRVVAVCLSNGRDINAEMIRQGWAVEYKQYSDGRYTDEEDEARRAKRGLWAGTFVMPWEWRRGQR